MQFKKENTENVSEENSIVNDNNEAQKNPIIDVEFNLENQNSEKKSFTVIEISEDQTDSAIVQEKSVKSKRIPRKKISKPKTQEASVEAEVVAI